MTWLPNSAWFQLMADVRELRSVLGASPHFREQTGSKEAKEIGESFHHQTRFQVVEFCSILDQHHTVDGRNPANHLGCVISCKWWNKLPINWCKISSINCILCFFLLAKNIHNFSSPKPMTNLYPWVSEVLPCWMTVCQKGVLVVGGLDHIYV